MNTQSYALPTVPMRKQAADREPIPPKRRQLPFIFLPFVRMPWKFAVRFTFASLLSVWVFEALVAIAICIIANQAAPGTFGQQQYLSEFGQTFAVPLAKHEDSKDINQLQFEPVFNLYQQAMTFPLGFIFKNQQAVLTDTTGKVVAHSGSGFSNFQIGRSVVGELDPEAAAQYRIAAGPDSGPRTSIITPGGESVVTSRIVSNYGSTVGYLVATSNRWSTFEFAQAAGLVMLYSSIPVLIIAGTVGIFFGLSAAKPLRRSLNRMQGVIKTWSNGDLTAEIPHRSYDEIGDLGTSLNAMMGEFRRYTTTQQKLATLEERNRMARDLHDTVKQQAFAAAMQIGAAKTVLQGSDSHASTFVGQAESLINKVQQDLMKIIQQLGPNSTGFVDQPIGVALKDEAIDWAKMSGIPVDIRIDPSIELDDDQSNTVLRITQEALANIAKHSGAARAQVSLGTSTDGAVDLVITDDGTGFDPLFASRGMGLHSMRDRAESLPGGSFNLETSRQTGTALKVRFTLTNDQDNT